MRRIGMKGTISAIMAAAAVLLLAFSINSAVMEENNNTTFAKMQAYRETAMKTEQAVRVLDNAFAKAIQEQLSSIPPCNSNINNVASKLEATRILFNSSNGVVTCTISNLTPQDGNPVFTVQGQLECSSVIDGTTTKKTIPTFSFSKTAFDNSGTCAVKDTVSNCKELPTPLVCP